MNLKDQMPFFNDTPPWYFRMMALGVVTAGYFVILAFIVIEGREYWPILILAHLYLSSFGRFAVYGSGHA